MSPYEFGDDYIHTYNRKEYGTKNSPTIVENHHVTIQFEEEASISWLSGYGSGKNNTSTILATASAIPPIAGPSQFVNDNNSLNESQTGPTQNPPTDLLLSNNENIGINIYSPMHTGCIQCALYSMG